MCFLHSYLDPAHERVAGEMIRKALPNAYVSLSHEILREYREFERMSTTVVNAFIGPKVGGYVKSLESKLGEIGFAGNLSIMRSNGGVMTPEVATERPVAMMESGPVGGIIAAAQVGLSLGLQNVISFDMGGTTAKASLIKDGEPTLAPGYYVGGYAGGHPVMLPMIDVVEVGAGGGSIAWIDDVGALKVGPQSAGADPGPVCYGGGGTEPTITDADVVLGRLDPDNFLGGQMKLDAEGARARHRGKNRQATQDGHGRRGAGHHRNRDLENVACGARGFCRQGLRPARFCAGRLRRRRSAACHCHRARTAYPDGDRAAVPVALLGPRHAARRRAPRLHPHLLFRPRRRRFRRARQDLPRHGCEAKASLRHTRGAVEQIQLDLRYIGQEFTLAVPVTLAQLKAGKRELIRKAFDALYEHRYAHHSPEEPVEMVNIRLGVIGKRPKLKFPRLGKSSTVAVSHRSDVYFTDNEKAGAVPGLPTGPRSRPAPASSGRP